MPELDIVAKTQSVFLYGENTADITPKIWVKLASEIHKQYKKFDGFVVLHGSDNILYTSSAISFLLQNTQKPIVFTGNLEASNDDRNTFHSRKNIGLKANFINALQVATLKVPEVGIVFGTRFARANQSKFVYEGNDLFYTCPTNAAIGKVDFSIRLFDKNIRNPSGKFKISGKLNDNITVIQMHPSFNISRILSQAKKTDGIIFDLSGYSDIPQQLISVFEKMKPKIPTLLYWPKNQRHVFKQSNIFVVSEMTKETAVTKFMWVLAQTKDSKKIAKIMRQNLAGEMVE